LTRRGCVIVSRMKMLGLVVFFLLVTSVAPALAQQGVIREIVVFGNEQVDKGIILKEIGSKVGEPFSQERVREDIKAIYRLGYFRDVQVDVAETKGAIILTYAVIEKPSVANIVISGNNKLSQEDIEGVIEIKQDSVLDIGKVRSSVTEIKKLYTAKRYFGSEVEYRVELEQGNKAVVYFDIVEGVKGYLTKITFVGNKVFGSRRLKKVMKTKEKGWVWWLSGAGKLETDVLEVDVSRIRSLYFDYGYVTLRVSEPEIALSKNKKSIQITVRIEEGEQYRLGSLDIQGDILTTKEKLLKGFKSRVEKVYSASRVQRDLLWLTDQYTDKGYAYADVAPLTMLDHEKKLVHLTFKIDKGIEAYIGRIAMEGNTKTRDKVIRREMKIAEGDLFSSTRVRKSRERVMRTGYFKEVEFIPSPTEKREFIDLDIRVEEQQMGKLGFGAGYSNTWGVLGSIELSHGNLFGLGYKASVSAELGGESNNFNVSFTDPRFLDTLVSLGFDAYNQTYEYETYASNVLGGGITIGREITDTIRGDLEYRLERVRIYDVDHVYASQYIIEQEGTSTTGKVILTFSRNTIDDPYNPRKGSQLWVSGTFAGLGGDNYFYGASGGASWFHPIVGDLVLNLRATAGMIRPYTDAPVPINEKFYLGGGKTMRGFEYGMAGPLDDRNEPIGALNWGTATTEFIYPLSKAIGLRAAVFYDVGKAWGGGTYDTKFNNSFMPVRHVVGAGIRWYSPFGPIRIDWGFNLNPRSYRGEKSSVWDFSMGAMF